MQRVPEPTRDVLVTRDEGGEREFSGFGAAKNDEYADCFIDADKMPEPTIKASAMSLVIHCHPKLCTECAFKHHLSHVQPLSMSHQGFLVDQPVMLILEPNRKGSTQSVQNCSGARNCVQRTHCSVATIIMQKLCLSRLEVLIDLVYLASY